MSAALPPHVATADEVIPPASAHPGISEPDMRTVTPLATMLAALAHVADDDVAFVERFRRERHPAQRAHVLGALALALPGVMLLLSTDPTDLADRLARTLRLPVRIVLAALVGLRRYWPRVPGTLVVLVGSIVVSSVFDLSGRGVEVIGDIHERLNATSDGEKAAAVELAGVVSGVPVSNHLHHWMRKLPSYA